MNSLRWAVSQPDLSCSARVILSHLVIYSGEGYHTCSVSLGTIASSCGVNKATVLRQLDNLESLGFITRRHRHGDDGRRVANIYRIHFQKEAVK